MTVTTPGNRWLILAVLCFARTSMGYQFQSIASISADLVREMGLSYAEIGTLIGLYMLPGVIVALPGGALASRFGDKSLAVVGLALMVLGDGMIAVVATPEALFSGRVVSGAGAVVFNLAVSPLPDATVPLIKASTSRPSSRVRAVAVPLSS